MICPRKPEVIFDGNVYTQRLKVPRGWLVSTMHLKAPVLTTVFVEDTRHLWELEEIPVPEAPVAEASGEPKAEEEV